MFLVLSQVGIGTTNPLDALHVASAVSTDYRGNLFLEDTTAMAAGVGGQVTFGGKYTAAGDITEWSAIQGTKSTASNDYSGQIEFKTRKQGYALETKMTLTSDGNLGIGTANPSRLQYGSVDPKLHVDQGWVTGSYNLTARFSAGGDENNTGASVLINHSNDRGLLIEAGREIGDTGIAHFGIVNAAGTNTRLMTLKQGGNVGIGQTAFGVNGKLQVTGGISTTGNSEIRQSTNSDGSTLRFLGTQLVIANSNANGYSYSGGGLVASVAPTSGAITLDVGANNTSGHRLKVINGSDGVAGSLQYLSGTTVQFKIDSLTGAIVTGNTTTRSITVSAGANATTLVELSGDGYQFAANVTLHTSRGGADHGMYQYFLTNYYGQDRSTTLVASSGTATANLAITMQYDFLGNNMSSKIRLVNTGASCEVIVYMTNPV